MYTASSSKTFAESAKELADGKTAMESLVKELNADISPAKTESWNTTVFSAAEAASLQRAADTLADAKSGSWVSIGSNNDKIQQAIAALSIGYQVVNRPDPVQLTKSAIDRAKTAQANIDTFLLAHDRLVGNLRAFLAQYATSYQPGCFAKSARSQNHQPNSKDWS